MSELYELPEGWEWKKLDELTEVNIGKTPTRSKKEYFLGDKVWLSIRDLKEDYISSSNEGLTDDAIKASNIKIVPKGTLLMSFKLTLGKTAFADCDLYTNEAIASLPIKNDSTLDKYFLKYALGTIDLEKEVDNAVKGKTLNKQKLKNLDIPLPPLQEQKRIVAKLDTLFAKIDQAIALHQQNIDEADALMGSVLNEVFGELEERYEINTLKDISTIISGYAFKSGDFSVENEIKSIKITNVGVQNFVEESDNKLPKEFLNKLSKYTVDAGDIVIALTRPYISNGLKVTIVPDDYAGAFVNQRVAAIQAKNMISITNYIYYYLCTSNVLNNVKELSKTLNQPNLSIRDLYLFKVPTPPLAAQQKTVTYLDQLSQKTEKLKQTQQEKMQSLKDLKASLLDRTFRGEL